MTRLTWLLLLLSVLAGCHSESPPLTPVASLTDVAKWGDSAAATHRLDLSNPALHLRSGWANPERDSAGRPFVWAVGEASEIAWTVLEPRDEVLVLRGWPYRWQGAPSQSVGVEIRNSVGGWQSVGHFDMAPGLGEYRVDVPAGLWQTGDNALRLVFSRATKPSDVTSSRDSRRLAAAWTGIALADGRPVGRSGRPVVEDDRIILPWDSRLDVFLELTERSFLEVDHLSLRGSGRLAIQVSRDVPAPTPATAGDSEALRTSDLDLTETPLRPVPLGDRGLVRLRFSALPDRHGSDVPADGIVLLRPRISTTTSEASIADPTPDSVVPDLQVPRVFVLYVVDTLRADHLSAWARDTWTAGPVPTPHLDAFASTSVVFRHTVAQSSWTKASVASIFTGMWPPSHGAIDRDDRLRDDLPALPEILQRNGWRTEAVVTNPNLTKTFGFDRGFDHFEYLGEEADAFEVNRAVERRLEALGDDLAASPLFVYVHVLDPHSPYDPPAAWRERMAPGTSAARAQDSLRRLNDLRQGRIPRSAAVLEELHRLYQAEIAAADEAFGQFLESLSSRGIDEPAVLFVSDHGEEFLEHGNLEHGRALHSESLRVPMALHWPGVEPRKIDRSVQHIDILPTILRRVGAPVPAGARGIDLLLPSPEHSHPRTLFSHLHLDGAERASILRGSFKAIVEFRAGCDPETGLRPERRWQLYEASHDPGEKYDLSSQHPVRLGFLGSLIRRQLGDCRETAAHEDQGVDLDEETRRSLEALGYL
ncbi:MAG: sulfatase-like hydrolase/transferase [Thermoanaerobaculia bacterium]|nr:sulfatase-like hydrolase/transferase [Thermoanaerobaculia bacterium]